MPRYGNNTFHPFNMWLNQSAFGTFVVATVLCELRYTLSDGAREIGNSAIFEIEMIFWCSQSLILQYRERFNTAYKLFNAMLKVTCSITHFKDCWVTLIPRYFRSMSWRKRLSEVGKINHIRSNALSIRSEIFTQDQLFQLNFTKRVLNRTNREDEKRGNKMDIGRRLR